jgi:hypothetical protein
MCRNDIKKETQMTKQAISVKTKSLRGFNPYKLVTNEEYGANLNALIAYYQIVRGEAKKRIASDRSSK